MYEYLICENSTYSLALAEASSAASFLDIPPYALLKSNPTVERCYCSDSGMEFCRDSPSGMTSAPLMEPRGVEEWMLFAEGFHARTSAAREREQESTEREAAYGERWHASFAKLDLATSSWKTAHCLPLEGLDGYLETWPKWGMMQDGECWEQTMLDLHTNGREYGFLPTPSGVKGAGHCVGALGEWGGSANIFRVMKLGNVRCPDFEEWAMDWPESWTEQMPYAMVKFQAWLRSHGEP